MQVRPKHEIARDIEETREALPQAWELVYERSPITTAARTGRAALTKWKARAREKSRDTDRKLRTAPYVYIVGALLLGAVAGVVFSAMRRRPVVKQVSTIKYR